MRLLAAAMAFTVVLLAGAAVAPAADVGANDDSAKHAADHGAGMYGEMAAVGLRQTVIGVRFKPSEALVIQDKRLLDRIIPNALDAGLRVVLAVYPYPPREIEAGLGSPALFASYVAAVAQVYPEVRQFVIGNEPNQPAFWRPQFTRSGANASGATFGRYLAAAYDSLKDDRPGYPGRRDRPLATRERQAEGEEQHLDVACALRAGARRLVSRERPHPAADGRVQLPPVPEQGDRPARARIPMAERRLRESRPRQAGAVGCIRRHRAADDAERPAAPPRRGRMAGRHVAVHGLPGARERPCHGRADPGGDLRRSHPQIRL